MNHEGFVNAVAALAIARVADPAARSALEAIKLVYGAGEAGLRGVTYYNQWSKNPTETVPFVEVCAMGEESWIQLAGTTIHELGHVLAGMGTGHGAAWKAACGVLGLRRVKAAGTEYKLAMFAPNLRLAIASLDKPDDGQPVPSIGAQLGMSGSLFRLRPCPAGRGSRGGKSRGIGSGSRLRLWQCGCGCKVRVASDTFQAVHTPCGSDFVAA